MRYLVTGGAGFIGSHLVDALLGLAGESEVIVLDNFKRGRPEFLSVHASDPRLTMVQGDVRDEIRVKECCREVDIVFHLAAQSNVLGANADYAYSVSSNVDGTVNVLDTARKAGVNRVVFTSSREVYGDARNLPVHEDSPLAPKNLYGASKVAGEMYCRAFVNMGLDVAILRLANVYGPRDRDRVIPLWIDRCRKGLTLQIYGGRQVLDLIAVDFVVKALVAAASAPLALPPINVGSGQGIGIVDLARTILEITKSPASFEVLPSRTEEVVRYEADVSRLENDLGLVPPKAPLRALNDMAKLLELP